MVHWSRRYYDSQQCPCQTLCIFSDLPWYHGNLPYVTQLFDRQPIYSSCVQILSKWPLRAASKPSVGYYNGYTQQTLTLTFSLYYFKCHFTNEEHYFNCWLIKVCLISAGISVFLILMYYKISDLSQMPLISTKS